VLGKLDERVAMSWLVYGHKVPRCCLRERGAQQLPSLPLADRPASGRPAFQPASLLVMIQTLAFRPGGLTLAALTSPTPGPRALPDRTSPAIGVITAFESRRARRFSWSNRLTARGFMPRGSRAIVLCQCTRFVGPSVAGLMLAACRRGMGLPSPNRPFFYLAIIATYAAVRVLSAPESRPG